MMKHEVTYCKALAIMLMVLGHSCGDGMLYVTQTIYMFHMPLFFFLSGFCFKEKYLTSTGTFVFRRFKGIWWPYVKWSLIFLFCHNLFVSIHFYGADCGAQSNDGLYYAPEYLVRIFDILFDMSGHEQLLGGYWFMHALLWGALIAYMIIYFSNRIKARYPVTYGYFIDVVCVGVLLGLMMFTNEYMRCYVGVLFPRTLMAAIFFFLGRLFSTYGVRKFRWWQSVLAFSLVIYGGFHWRLEPANYFYQGQTLQIPLYICTALLGIWVMYSLPWTLVKEESMFSKVINYIGNNTLTILTWHFVCFKLVAFVLIRIYHLPEYYLTMFPVISEYSDKGWWVAYFLIGVTLPLLSLLLINRLCQSIGNRKWMMGNKNN